MSLPKTAPILFRLPSSWATGINFQSRYPGGILVTKMAAAASSAFREAGAVITTTPASAAIATSKKVICFIRFLLQSRTCPRAPQKTVAYKCCARFAPRVISQPISSLPPPARWPSLVIRWQLLLSIALGLIVVNPELRMFLRNDCRYLVHGMERRILAPIIRRDIAIFEASLEMRNIAAQNHWSSFREPHEQRLVAGRVSGRGEQHEAPVAKDIVVAVNELDRMLLVKGHGVLPAPSPFVLDSLHQHRRVGKHFDVPRVVRVAM